jgi:hypothetical protein
MGAGLCYLNYIMLIFGTLKKQASLTVEDRSILRSSIPESRQPIQRFLSSGRCLYFRPTFAKSRS